MIFFARYRYGGRYTVSMLPGDGIGPEMMGYVKDIFREVGAPVDFETVELDPTTDNYDDLHNVITCQIIYFRLFLFEISYFTPHTLFIYSFIQNLGNIIREEKRMCHQG